MMCGCYFDLRLTHQNAVEGVDYSLDKLVPFWEKTNDADWKICEYTMQGILSSRYKPEMFVKVTTLLREAHMLLRRKRVALRTLSCGISADSRKTWKWLSRM